MRHGIAHALLALAAVAFHAREFDHARDIYAEAASRYEAAQSWGDALAARLWVADCELQLGRLDETADILPHGIPRLHEFSDVTMNVQALRVAARLAAGRGDVEDCATLLGAADSRLEESGLTIFSPAEDEPHRACLRQVRDTLGDAPFTAAYQTGVEASDEAVFVLAGEVAR